MSYQPHYIASFENDSGMITYFEPFLIPEKAFSDLEDAYCFRGRVIKRPGYKLLGRLRRSFTTEALTDISAGGAGNVVINLFIELGVTAAEVNAQIQLGSESPISIAIAAPISQTLTDTTGSGIMTIAPAGVIDSAILNYNTGILTLHFTAGVAASHATFTGAYFPGLPVMGLRTQETGNINDENLVAFDQVYAYKINPVTKQFEDFITPVTVTWNGDDSNFFWTTNYWEDTNGMIFWVTNTNMRNTIKDPMYYWDTSAWTKFFPYVDSGKTTYLVNAEVIIPFKDHLLFLNTWEGPLTMAGEPDLDAATNFPQRIRWSSVLDPISTGAYDSTTPGKGGYRELPTSEQIVTAYFQKDVLIVKCERSSWKLIYTGNEVQPFVVQKINTELGSESKYSIVPFDDGLFSVADVGLMIDDSNSVRRIDLQIPNTVFNFDNLTNGVVRVQGIRDYFNELIYLTFPYSANKTQISSVYPNKVLIYNYRNNTYGSANDSFTCFGYFQQEEPTWSQLNNIEWQSWTSPWNSAGLQSLFPNVVGGNQQGFVEIVSKYQSSSNDQSLMIKAINFVTEQFTIPNHNLQNDDVIQIDNIAGTGTPPPTDLNGERYLVAVIDKDTISLMIYDPTYDPLYPTWPFINFADESLIDPSAVYLGGGIVTKITRFSINTKVFVPFYETGNQCRVGYIDYLIDKTTDGQVTGDIYINEDSNTSITDQSSNESLIGSNVIHTNPENLTLIPYQANQNKIWHRQFIECFAQNFQIELSLSAAQAADPDIGDSDFQLHALAFYLSPNARLTQ